MRVRPKRRKQRRGPRLSAPTRGDKRSHFVLKRPLPDRTRLGARPRAHRSRGGRTRAPMAPNEDALQDDRVSYRFAERGAKRRHFPILRDA